MVDSDANKHDRISPTADLVSYFRAFSDIPYTKEIAELTNAREIASAILGDLLESSMYLAATSEARFKRINIHAQGYKNILEVAVGRSPRDLIFTEDPEIEYVATDLPDSLDHHREIILTLIEKHGLSRPNLQFASVDALKLAEMQKAAALLPPGPVAIISEGFMVYLTKEEKRTFLAHVHSILSERGGCLITSDVLVIPKTTHAFQSVHGAIAQTAGRDPSSQSFGSVEEAESFVVECGFDAKVVTDEVDITSIQTLSLENDPKTQWILKAPVWVLTTQEHGR